MVRWDSPLFTILWTEDVPPASQIWEAITKGVVKPPNSGTLAVRIRMIVERSLTDLFGMSRPPKRPWTHCIF